MASEEYKESDLSKKIVEMHKGNIGVESTLGKGSTFWFSLPINAEV